MYRPLAMLKQLCVTRTPLTEAQVNNWSRNLADASVAKIKHMHEVLEKNYAPRTLATPNQDFLT